MTPSQGEQEIGLADQILAGNLVLEEIPIDSLRGPRAVLLDML